MLDKVAGSIINGPKDAPATTIRIELERGLQRAFEEYFAKKHKRKLKVLLSGRGEKTYIFPWADEEGYEAFVLDAERFRREVVEHLSEYAHTIGHKPTCKGHKGYNMIGFRPHDRKTIMVKGQGRFPIRMVQCKDCGEKFSLLPSFLPREKHFGIDIIGHVFQNILLYSQSLQAALENLKIIERGAKSKQTILNWLRWMGALHPATILTRAGIRGTGYFQEDEGFEREPNLRTYTVFMVDPKTLLVWHADYVDHVDEETLCASFEKFLQRVSFKILGVTKDKWDASTKALKAVFKGIWIGFCHRHCLTKFRQALITYQEQTKCSDAERGRLYKKFKDILETSNSQISVEVKIKALDDQAFRHPLLQERLAELKENASHYACHKRRNGITKTTSMVDNFLKLVKRKLIMAQSFRDREYAHILFQALANTRNFLPFSSGAKNAHKSPFMLAEGQTHGLPWIQVMNIHNAFLFTPNAG
jgi:hypothetical protein